MFNKRINEIADEKIKTALQIAWSYGQVAGSSYKAWVIDQMVRVLCGSEEEYREWVETYETPISYGEYYEWDTGIAP